MKLNKEIYNYKVQKEKLIGWAVVEFIDNNYNKARKLVDVAYRLSQRYSKHKKGW